MEVEATPAQGFAEIGGGLRASTVEPSGPQRKGPRDLAAEEQAALTKKEGVLLFFFFFNC